MQLSLTLGNELRHTHAGIPSILLAQREPSMSIEGSKASCLLKGNIVHLRSAAIDSQVHIEANQVDLSSNRMLKLCACSQETVTVTLTLDLFVGGCLAPSFLQENVVG